MAVYSNCRDFFWTRRFKKHQLRFCLLFIFAVLLLCTRLKRNEIQYESNVCVCVLHERCVYFAHLIEITVMLHPSTLSEHMCCDRKQHSNANVSFFVLPFLFLPFFHFAETATDNRYAPTASCWTISILFRFHSCTFCFSTMFDTKFMTNNTNIRNLLSFLSFLFRCRNFPWRTRDTAARQISLIRWCSDATDSPINEPRSRRAGFIRDRLMIFRQFSVRIRVLWLLYEIKITVKKHPFNLNWRNLNEKKCCFSKIQQIKMNQ